MLRRFSREDGQSLLLITLCLPLLFIIAAFVVDVSNAFVHKQSAQNSADNISLALAQDINAGGGFNGSFSADNVSYTNANVPTLASGLHACSPATTSTSDTNCYISPPPTGAANAGDPNSIYVKVTLPSPSFFGWSRKLFGGLGLTQIQTTATSVASPTSGPPPDIQFAALNDGCDNHTLLIKAGGVLKVTDKIYVNSCNVPNDAFDVFGGGSIIAPQINVVGGWETHNSSTVFGAATSSGNGTQCPLTPTPGNSKGLYNAGTKTFAASPAGCPIDGTTKITDPFLKTPAPTLSSTPAAGVSAAVVEKGRSGCPGSCLSTLQTGSDFGAYPGASITVSGMSDSTFNGPFNVASANGTTLTYNQANGLSNVPTGPGTTATIQSAMLKNYVAKLTLSSALTVSVGQSIVVAGIDNALNGTFAVTGVSGGGTVVTYNDNNAQASTLYTTGAAKGANAFTGESLVAGGTATVTVSGQAPSAGVGDQVTVSNATAEPVFDGTWQITGTTGTTVSFVPTAFAMTFQEDYTGGAAGSCDPSCPAAGTSQLDILGPTDPPASLQGAKGAGATIVVSSGDPPNGDPRFDGTQTVTKSDNANDLIQYAANSFSFGNWTANANVVTLNASNTGLQVGDKINVTFSNPQPAGCVTAGMPVAVTSSSPTQVTYAENNCTGKSGSNGNKITINTAAGDDENGTATVTAASATPANGSTVTIPVDETKAGGTVNIHTISEASGIVTLNNTGTPGTPKPYRIPSGTLTLNPGTYYGGICIGAPVGAADCTGTNCSVTTASTANVTLIPGNYIMAGGGFHVCGGSAVTGNGVMIYNTQDPPANSPTGNYWKIGQVQFNTTGLVTLSPPTGGDWSGLTIFQDRSLTLTRNGVTTNTHTCDQKSGQLADWDIAFEAMGDPGNGSGALSTIIGTIYAPNEQLLGGTSFSGSDFGSQVSGTSDLAVITSCIFINGSNDTFNLTADPRVHHGIGYGLSG
jgi:Flp pilus assembly protein TadG